MHPNLIKLASNFHKIAVDAHAVEINNLYSASRNMLNAVSKAKKAGSEDKTVTDGVNDIAQAAARLLWNLNNYGVSVQTSSKYKGNIQVTLGDLQNYINNQSFNPYEDNVYVLVGGVAGGMNSILDGFSPTAVSAQRPPQNQFAAGKTPGSPGYVLPAASVGQGASLPVNSPWSPYEAKTLPGPNGERIPDAAAPEPAVAKEPAPSVAKEPVPYSISDSTLNWTTPSVPAAQLGTKYEVPLTGKDKEIDPWTLKLNSFVEKFIKLAGTNNPDYRYYVLVDDKIESGWEYQEDAMDQVKEILSWSSTKESEPKIKVYTLRHLRQVGLDPNDDASWVGADPESMAGILTREAGRIMMDPIEVVDHTGEVKQTALDALNAMGVQNPSVTVSTDRTNQNGYNVNVVANTYYTNAAEWIRPSDIQRFVLDSLSSNFSFDPTMQFNVVVPVDPSKM